MSKLNTFEEHTLNERKHDIMYEPALGKGGRQLIKGIKNPTPDELKNFVRRTPRKEARWVYELKTKTLLMWDSNISVIHAEVAWGEDIPIKKYLKGYVATSKGPASIKAPLGDKDVDKTRIAVIKSGETHPIEADAGNIAVFKRILDRDPHAEFRIV